MTPYECYCDYLAIKSHFTKPKYDYFKYSGKVNTTYDKFIKRRDVFLFEKLSRQKDPHGLMVANFMKNQKPFVIEIMSEEGQRIYDEWNKNRQSLMYRFKNDLSKLDEPFSSNFRGQDGDHPKLIKLFLGGEISMETLAILTHTFKAFKCFDNQLKDDVIWNDISLKIKKAKSFINYDEDKVAKLVVDYFVDLE